MQHCNETVNIDTSKQESETSQVSMADSTLLASNLTGSGDITSTGRPVMEQPSGKAFSSCQNMNSAMLSAYVLGVTPPCPTK